MLLIGLCRRYRVKIRDDVFVGVLTEIDHSLILSFARIDEQGVPAPQHILHNARGADALCRIVLVEREFGIPGAHVQDSNGSHQFDGDPNRTVFFVPV